MLLGLVATLSVAAVVGTAGAASNAFPQGSSFKILFVSQTPSSDSFGSIIVNGFNAACREYQVKCTYRALSTLAFNAADMIKLLQDAKAAHPDGLIAANPAPGGLNATLKGIADSGIPLVLANTGYGQTAATGALTFIGNQEYSLGQTGGAMLKQLGAKHAVLLTAQPGIPLVDERNAGFKAGFKGTVASAAVAAADLSNSSKMTNVLKATLLKNKNVDAVFSVGSALNPSMLAARASLGSRAAKIHWSSIDLGPLIVKALQNKQMDFALAQQQYLEGYLAVQDLVFYLRGGFQPARAFTPVGPLVVTPANIAQFVQSSNRGLN